MTAPRVVFTVSEAETAAVASALAARLEPNAVVLLVGDLPYYVKFGFKPVPEGQIVMPGPVNPARLLAVEVTEGALGAYRGAVAGVRA